MCPPHRKHLPHLLGFQSSITKTCPNIFIFPLRHDTIQHARLLQFLSHDLRCGEAHTHTHTHSTRRLWKIKSDLAFELTPRPSLPTVSYFHSSLPNLPFNSQYLTPQNNVKLNTQNKHCSTQFPIFPVNYQFFED